MTAFKIKKGLASRHTDKYIVRLYLAGATARSRQALLRVRRFCERELQDRCELEVIDIYQQPDMACDGQIIATPTLVRVFPLPVRRLIGDLSDVSWLFAGLDLGQKW